VFPSHGKLDFKHSFVEFKFNRSSWKRVFQRLIMFKSQKQWRLKIYFPLQLKITQKQINRKTLPFLFFKVGIGFCKVIIQ